MIKHIIFANMVEPLMRNQNFSMMTPCLNQNHSLQGILICMIGGTNWVLGSSNTTLTSSFSSKGRKGADESL